MLKYEAGGISAKRIDYKDKTRVNQLETMYDVCILKVLSRPEGIGTVIKV